METEDPALIAEFKAQGEEIYDITAGENLARVLPSNLVFGFIQKWKSLNAAWKVNSVRLDNKLEELGSPNG